MKISLFFSDAACLKFEIVGDVNRFAVLSTLELEKLFQRPVIEVLQDKYFTVLNATEIELMEFDTNLDPKLEQPSNVISLTRESEEDYAAAMQQAPTGTVHVPAGDEFTGHAECVLKSGKKFHIRYKVNARAPIDRSIFLASIYRPIVPGLFVRAERGFAILNTLQVRSWSFAPVPDDEFLTAWYARTK